MKHLVILLSYALAAAYAMAQTSENDSIANDSTNSTQLGEIVVEAKQAKLGAEVSTFIPTSKQKNASQNAIDLLNRMALPQLRVSKGDEVTDEAGKPADIFIDYLPATKQDIDGMNTADVKRVEYYDFPSDPRFLGKQHVVNFIMQQYEYGGYVKPYLERSLIAGTAQWAIFNRLQYRRMTFDLNFDGFYKDQNRIGSDIDETYRLPQTDGSTNVVTKHSATNTGSLVQNSHYAIFRAKYASGKLNLRNSLMLTLDRRPRNDHNGDVSYSDPAYKASAYSSQSDSRSNSISYNGDFYLIFDQNNYISGSPRYAYSHTNTSSTYYEDASAPFYNAAIDNSHNFVFPVTFSHCFGTYGKLNLYFKSSYSENRTKYFGTAESDDKLKRLHFNAGANYALTIRKFYGYAGAGCVWNRTAIAIPPMPRPRPGSTFRYTILPTTCTQPSWNTTTAQWSPPQISCLKTLYGKVR